MARTSKKLFDELTKEWEPRLRDAFLAAVYRLRGSVNKSKLVEYIQTGRIEDAASLVNISPTLFRTLDVALEQTFEAGGSTFAKSIPQKRMPNGFQLKIEFDVRHPEAERWLRNRSSELVKNISDDTRAVLQRTLQEGLARGDNPRVIANDIVGTVNRVTGRREGGVLGLNDQQKGWLNNYKRDLASSDPADLAKLKARGLRDGRYDKSIDKAIKEGRGLTAKMQADMARQYENNALFYRGETIARTEALESLRTSQRQAYNQAIDAGQLDRRAVKRFWKTAGDERVRDDHRAIPGMNPTGVGMDEPFNTPNGPMMNPSEPNCRCIVQMDIDYFYGLD